MRRRHVGIPEVTHREGDQCVARRRSAAGASAWWGGWRRGGPRVRNRPGYSAHHSS